MRNIGGWLALVPVKLGESGKSRLSAVLDAAARARLAQGMAQHVLDALGRCEQVAQIGVLSPERVDWAVDDWWPDHGRGLNLELAACRAKAGARPLLVVLGDLPLVTPEDFSALLAAATTHGAAMATDREGRGTNALALADGRPFTFGFGPNSRAMHERQDHAMPVLTRTGLEADVDTAADLAYVRQRGCLIPGL